MIVGKIVGRIGVVFSSGHLKWFIIVGDIDRAPKHQVLKQMGKACFAGILISCTYIIHDIHHRHGSRSVLVDNNSQAIGKGKFFELYHI
jgi:hypothetical protein